MKSLNILLFMCVVSIIAVVANIILLNSNLDDGDGLMSGESASEVSQQQQQQRKKIFLDIDGIRYMTQFFNVILSIILSVYSFFLSRLCLNVSACVKPDKKERAKQRFNTTHYLLFFGLSVKPIASMITYYFLGGIYGEGHSDTISCLFQLSVLSFLLNIPYSLPPPLISSLQTPPILPLSPLISLEPRPLPQHGPSMPKVLSYFLAIGTLLTTFVINTKNVLPISNTISQFCTSAFSYSVPFPLPLPLPITLLYLLALVISYLRYFVYPSGATFSFLLAVSILAEDSLGGLNLRLTFSNTLVTSSNIAIGGIVREWIKGMVLIVPMIGITYDLVEAFTMTSKSLNEVGAEVCELSEKNEKLQAQNSTLNSDILRNSGFLSSLASELKALLHTANTNVGLLSDTDVLPSQKGYLEKLEKSIDHLSNVVRESMLYSEMEAQKPCPDMVYFRLDQLLEEVIATTALKTPLEDKETDLFYLVQNDVPQNLLGDYGRLKNILLRLLGNAVKATSQGEVAILVFPEKNPTLTPNPPTSSSLNTRKSVNDQEEITLSIFVMDTGIGIPRENVNKLFEPFSILNHNREEGDLGLGLAICKQLARLFNASLTVQSELSRGTTFNLICTFKIQASLPSAPQLSNLIAHTGPRSLLLNNNTESKWGLGHTVVVIDSNPRIGDVITMHLEPAGCEVLPFTSSSEALVYVRRRTLEGNYVSMIIVDYKVPGVATGEDFVKSLRSDSFLRSIPVTVLCTPKQRKLVSQVNFLFKPIRKDQLVQIVYTAITTDTNNIYSIHTTPNSLKNTAILTNTLNTNNNIVNSSIANVNNGHSLSYEPAEIKSPIKPSTTVVETDQFISTPIPSLSNTPAILTPPQTPLSKFTSSNTTIVVPSTTPPHTPHNIADGEKLDDNISNLPNIDNTSSSSSSNINTPDKFSQTNSDNLNGFGTPMSKSMPVTPTTERPFHHSPSSLPNIAMPLQHVHAQDHHNGRANNFHANTASAPSYNLGSRRRSIGSVLWTVPEEDAIALRGDNCLPSGVASLVSPRRSFRSYDGFGNNDKEEKEIENPSTSTTPTPTPDVEEQKQQKLKAPQLILLVEDNPVNAKIATAVLRRHHFEVDLSINGQLALERAKTNHDQYMLILMDIHMPVMDGLTCAKLIRTFEEEHKLDQIPIIALTADISPDHRAKCLDAGCNEFLSKPLDYPLLVEVLKRLNASHQLRLLQKQEEERERSESNNNNNNNNATSNHTSFYAQALSILSSNSGSSSVQPK